MVLPKNRTTCYGRVVLGFIGLIWVGWIHVKFSLTFKWMGRKFETVPIHINKA